MDLLKKRKLKQILRGLISDGFSGTQQDLSLTLKQRGFKVNQSTVSRILNQIGVIKENRDGKAFYKIKNDTKSSYRGSLADLVNKVVHNSVNIVIKTKPGSAMFVAGFIDHEFEEHILGTVAGDDTILVVPLNIKKIDKIAKNIQANIAMIS